tara:strand:- start:2820 stop:3737 length:918 start_codon:yes stop_codon:yes gene_type:complete
MRVGIIGNGVHSKRMQKILGKKKINFFIYKPNNKKYYDRDDFDKLKKNKIIFILSPNNSHYNYIKALHKNRYIFCEKPPVGNKNQINKIKKINYKKIYFDYNSRFSRISEILKIRKKYNLGKLIYANILSSHGLALKKEYKKNWRSNKKKCPKGVFEVVSIHWIDLINYHFKIAKLEKPNLLNHSKKGNSFDTSHIKLTLDNGGIVDIATSYNAPLTKKIFFLFNNGTIEQNGTKLEIRGPAINLDKNKFFKKPKIISRYTVNENKDYQISLEKSIDYFLKIVRKRRFFDKKLFMCSIKSNKLLF